MNDYFEHYIESDSFHLKYAKGSPSVKGQEFHVYHEFVLFLDGKAQIGTGQTSMVWDII